MWILGGVLSLLAFLFYIRTYGFDWLTGEDGSYVFANPYVTGVNPNGDTISLLHGFRWCLQTMSFGQWIPIPLCVHKVMVMIFSLEAGWHHVLNALIHAGIVATMFGFFVDWFGRERWVPIFYGVAIFAVHSQHVQLVAWVSELKDLLSYWFGLLSVWFYYRWMKKERSSERWLWLALGMFVLGLMSRFIIAGLPLVLLVMHALKSSRGRTGVTMSSVRSIDRGKWTLFALVSVVFVWLTASGHASQKVRFSMDEISFVQQVVGWVWVPFEYLRKTIVCYPLPFFNSFDAGIPLWVGGACALGIVLVGFTGWFLRKKCPELFFGWMWFVLSLLPVCGVITLGPNHYSDHYSYLPHMALLPCAMIGIDRLLGGRTAMVLGLVGVLVFGFFGQKHLSRYRGTMVCMQTEWGIQSDPKMLFSIASLLYQEGDLKGGIGSLIKANMLDEGGILDKESAERLEGLLEKDSIPSEVEKGLAEFFGENR